MPFHPVRRRPQLKAELLLYRSLGAVYNGGNLQNPVRPGPKSRSVEDGLKKISDQDGR